MNLMNYNNYKKKEEKILGNLCKKSKDKNSGYDSNNILDILEKKQPDFDSSNIFKTLILFQTSFFCMIGYLVSQLLKLETK